MTYPSALDGSLDDASNDMKGACKLVLTPCYNSIQQSLSADDAIRCACASHGGCRQWGTVGRDQVVKTQLPLDLQSATRTVKQKRSLAGVPVLARRGSII